MKTVMKEILLQDYNDLANKKALKLAEIEQEAKAFAVARGYDPQRTAEFIAFVQKTENDGLTDAERKEFEVLNRYVIEVEETTEETNQLATDAAGEIIE